MLIFQSPPAFLECCEKILKKSEKLKASYDNWSYEMMGGLIKGGIYGNFAEEAPIPNAVEIHEDFSKRGRVRRVSCYNCGLARKDSLSLNDGRYSFSKCQAMFIFMFATKIRDLDFSLRCFSLCEKYGLDALSTSNYIGFVIDLYEKGILTKENTEGLHLEWGNEGIAFTLIELQLSEKSGCFFGDLVV